MNFWFKLSKSPVTKFSIVCLYCLFQVYVDGRENTVVLQGLDPLTEYGVKVFSTVDDESSDPLQGVETTRGFSHDSIFTYV